MKDYEELSKKHFDNQAKIYDETDTAYYSKYPKISCKDVAERLKNTEYTSLLDISCGTGYLLNMLLKQQKAQYQGLDLSPEMLKAAREKLTGNVILTEGSADSLPYEDSSFDIVTCVQSFHHYPRPEKAMREALRVLKPGGLYIISDTGLGNAPRFIYNIYNNFIVNKLNTGDFAAYNAEDIQKMMTSQGFKVKTSEKITRFIYTVIGVK